MTAVLIIEGMSMPAPAYRGYTTRKEELVKAARNVGNIVEITATKIIYGADAGNLVKHHLNWKYTIDVKWVGLSPTEKNKIMTMTGGEKFSVTFLDMDTNKYETAQMYRGTGQTITGWGKFTSTENGGYFEHYDVSLSLVEL
jgi:hypothetical protein